MSKKIINTAKAAIYRKGKENSIFHKILSLLVLQLKILLGTEAKTFLFSYCKCNDSIMKEREAQ